MASYSQRLRQPQLRSLKKLYRMGIAEANLQRPKHRTATKAMDWLQECITTLEQVLSKSFLLQLLD